MPPDENSGHDIFTHAIAPAPASVPIPRALLVFAHQDDETIALGARLGNFTEAHIVHVTDGAPRNEHDSRHHGFATLADYRRARDFELCTVLTAAGLGSVSRECLRIPDQEACVHLALLTRALGRIIRQHEPQVIFTHPYEGGHPDHDACAFAVHNAVEPMERTARPFIIETPFYHAGPRGHEAGTFLPTSQIVPEAEFRLTPEEFSRKHKLLALFVSQRQTLGGFPLQYERFRIAPQYDFLRPPHTPPVLYDNQPWGMSSREFTRLACDAVTTLTRNVPAECL